MCYFYLGIFNNYGNKEDMHLNTKISTKTVKICPKYAAITV